MRNCLLLSLLLPFAATACVDVVTSGPSVVTVEIDDVTSSSVKVGVVLSGDMPTNCRMTKAFLVEDVDASSFSEDEIYNIAQVEGHSITLPYAENISELSPFKEYNVMVAYETNTGRHGKYVTFTTLPEAGTVSIFLAHPSATWEQDDTAGLFSCDIEGTTNVNTALKVSDFYIGDERALFQPVSEIQLPKVGSDRFFIYYPYDEGTTLSKTDYAIHSVLKSEQGCDPSSKVSPGAFFCGIKEVNTSTNQFNLALEDILGTIEFKVETSKYPGFSIKDISIFDFNQKAVLSGEFAYDPDKETVKPTANGESSISVKNLNPEAEGNLKMSVIPGDYSSCDLRLFVSLESSGTSVVVPMKYPGGLNVGKGETVLCEISSLEPDSEAYPWYEPLEKRDYLDEVAYGAQNTYCIECKPNAINTITFDVKARGNILGGKVPVYYGILLPSNLKSGKLLVLPDGTDIYEEAPAREIPSDYRITVGCYGQDQAVGTWGVVAIYDKDYNILWSFMIWRYDSGDPISSVEYTAPGFTLMDRALGAAKGLDKAVSDGSLGVSVAYFEWGRKDPFPWYNQVPEYYIKESPKAGNGVEYALAHPNIWLTYSSSKAWLNENRKELWGNENATTANNTSIVGHKTIYDPCPEGWRVCDYSVCDYVHKNKVFAERPAASSETRYKVQNKNKALHLAKESPYSDYSVVAISLGGDKYDYWPYYGLMWGSTNAWANKSGNDTDYAYAYWSNSNNSKSNDKASVLVGYYTSSSWTATTSMVMADMYNVRCQKETKAE